MAKLKERLGILTVGWIGNLIMVYGFDLGLYPLVLWHYGTLRGWFIMTWASLLICLLTLKFYDWSKRDWIGIEALKSLRDGEAKGKLARFSAWMLKQGDPIALIFLSVKTDPLITALYLRRGANKFDGFGRRDWVIFFASLIISNLYWGLIVLAGLDIIQFAWEHLKGYLV